MSVPRLVAHRGYAWRYPENTLAALQAALQLGACFVEWDVQLTRDRVSVLLHDASLERTAGRPESVFDLSVTTLSQIAIKQRPAAGDYVGEERVPTLAAAIQLLTEWPRARAFVEIKPESLERFGAVAVLESVATDLSRSPDQVIPISSVVDFLVLARGAGHGEIGLVLREWSEATRKRLDRLQPDYVFCNLQRIPAEAPLWSGPWSWVVYEIVDPDLALNLATRGVDLIETMAIGEMLADPRLAPGGCRE